MIAKREIREKARESGVPVSTIERDYAQDWLLTSLSSLNMVLKGGTGIRKAYIGDYRFSDDLDFTLLEVVAKKELEALIKESVKKTKEESGINFSEDIGFQENDNGFEIDVYFQIMQGGGSRTRIKIDITKSGNEKILLPLKTKRIIHPYSDDLKVEVRVYSLEEIVVEKVRSLFQRTRPRDLYDVWYLWDEVDKRKVLDIFPGKCRFKNVKINVKDFEGREDDFKNAWGSSLQHQLKNLPDFDDVFSSVMEKVMMIALETSREAILTGETGALLHDIGKCHPDFIKRQSLENIRGLPHHARDIDDFINSQLLAYFRHEKFRIKLNREEKTVYDLIRYHHDASRILLKFLEKCDHKDSADDKGVVRKKQSIEGTTISSPFGHPKEKTDLECLQKRFEDLEDNLIGLFRNYISGTIDIGCFRETLINNLEISFSHALGETRIPANDVTLWDHSYSTASLFKSVLAAMVCGANIDPENLKWRIFGICWDGVGFINKGRKIAEIQARSDVIENVKSELKRKFEDEIPVGNAIYEGTNGIFFTFPDLDDKSKELAKECAKIALEKVYGKSDNELWSFFTLSKASGTLTIIADELKFASEKRKIPEMSPIPKDVKKERCDVCEERRKGRLLQWLSNRQDTIWIDEVADRNNRVALISLSFNLDKWLDGTMIGTVYSQSFEDWLDKEKENLSKIEDEVKEKIKKQIKSLEKAIEGMKKADSNKVKARIDEKNKEKKELEQKTKQFTFTLSPDKKTAYRVLDIFFEVKDDDEGTAAKILDTFFEEDIGLDKDSLEKHLSNIKERMEAASLTEENLAAYLFTQNPSPARLYRIWRETEEFFDLVLQEIKDKIYSHKWKRIKFSVDYSDLKSKLNLDSDKNIEDTPLIIKIKGLNPENLLVFHTKNGESYTIESLVKFKFNNKTGKEAVKEALKQGFEHIALEDEPNKNLLQNKVDIDENSIKTEEYYPLIEINKSPLSLRLIVPALDSVKIIELITKFYNERFEKVIGKLPLNVKLLVAKRKFPLYVILDAEKRMLEGDELKKQVSMNPWWDINGLRNDKNYGFYPTEPIKENGKYVLDDMSKLSEGKIFSLCPGYFDFDLLLGTTDRYRIYYDNMKRADEDYKLFTARPYYFYQMSSMLELWGVLSNIPSSQINSIEEMLASKLREWRNIEDGNKQKIFREFAKATLWDAFGDKWNGLRGETRYFLVNSAINGLLLDTIILFRHVIKKEVDKND